MENNKKSRFGFKKAIVLMATGAILGAPLGGMYETSQFSWTEFVDTPDKVRAISIAESIKRLELTKEQAIEAIDKGALSKKLVASLK